MSTIPGRVTVLDTWDEVKLEVTPETPVAELKRRALAQARVTRSADAYQVKFRGALVRESGQTLGEAGVGPNAPLIVLPARRYPTR